MVSASHRKRTPAASLMTRERSLFCVVLCLSTDWSHLSSEAFILPSRNTPPKPSSVRFYNIPLQGPEPSRESWRDSLYSTSSTPSNTSTLDVSTYFQDMPSMDDLYHNLDLLEHGLEAKNEQYHQLVHNLQIESEQAVESLQQWEAMYQTKIDQLESQSASAEQSVFASERELYTLLEQLRKESEAKEKNASDKIRRLAEQLQTVKMETHKQQLQSEQAARSRQEELQEKLKQLESDLQRQIQETESEKANHGESWQKRKALELELAATQKELTQIIKDLKQRVGLEQERRLLEQQLHKKQLEAQELQIREQLRGIRNQYATDTAALESRLKGSEALHEQTLQEMKGAFQKREAEMQEALKRVSSELQKLRFDSHAKLMAEKSEFAQREAALRKEMDQKEAEIQKQAEVAALQSSKAESLWQKRIELEQEVSALRHNYVIAVAEWENRIRSVTLSGKNELLAKDELLMKQEDSARAKINATEQEVESLKKGLLSSLEAKDSEHRSAMQQLRSSLVYKIKELTDRLQKKSDELQESRFASHRILMSQKDASMVEQTRLLADLRQKERELDDQVALTNAASAQARAHWASRMELEKELSMIKLSYDKAMEEWEDRLETINVVRAKELNAAKQLLSQSELEAQKLIRAATQDSAAQKAALEESLKAKETHFRQIIEELRWDSEKEKERLRSYLDSINNDLQRYKIESQERLISQKNAFKIRQDQLISEIKSKEEELRKQVSLTASTEETSKFHWQKRMDLEKELAELRHSYKSAVVEWRERVRVMELEHIAQQQRLEAQLTQTREKARLEVDAAYREVEERKVALKKTVEMKEIEHRRELQHVIDSSRMEVQDRDDKIQTLTVELEQYKVESERRLDAMKKAAEAEQNELKALLSVKEKQYSEQLELTILAEDKSRDELLQRSKLEQELSSMKVKFEEEIKQWEHRYSLLLESRDQALREAEEELARREEEARALTEKFVREAETANLLHAEDLRAKDQELDLIMQEVRSNSEKRIQELHQQLRAVSDSYEQLKLESNKNLEAAKEAALRKEENLRMEIQNKEAELADQVSIRSVQQSRAEELWSKRAELEFELSNLRRQYESEKTEWETKYRTLQETQARELSAASALLERSEAEAALQIQMVIGQAKNQTLALESELQAQASRHKQVLQELTHLSQTKEAELSHKLFALEEKLKISTVSNEKAAARVNQNELQTKIMKAVQEVEETRNLLVKEEARSKELTASCTKLEKELTSLQAKYDAEVLKWTKLHEGLQATLSKERSDNADRFARKELSARGRILREIKASRNLRDSLRQELKLKDAAYRRELKALQEKSSKKEEDLKNRLTAVTKQFEQFKTEVQNRPSTTSQRGDMQQERTHSEPSSDATFYESERARYDLTKQLVKKNVELIRQEVELKQKDAQISAMKSTFFDTGQKEVQVKLNLSAIKDRVAKLLRREVDKTVIPYTFSHNLKP